MEFGHAATWLRAICRAAQDRRDCSIQIWAHDSVIASETMLNTTPLVRPGDWLNFGVSRVDLSAFPLPRAGASSYEKFEYVRTAIDAAKADLAFVALNLDALLRHMLFTSMEDKQRYRLAGFLGCPNLHYPFAFSKGVRRWTCWRDYLRSFIVHGLGLQSPGLATALTLDPYAPPFYNGLIGSTKLFYVPETTRLLQTRCRNVSAVSHFRVGFFGRADRRKGLECLLRGIEYLLGESPELASHLTLYIWGEISAEVASSIEDLVKRIQLQHKGWRLEVFGNYLSEVQFDEALCSMDIITVPYLRFAGSSNIQVLAASAGIPVLCSDFGLMAEYCREYQLGALCSPERPETVARALRELIDSSLLARGFRSNCSRFLAKRSTSEDLFGGAVLRHLLETQSNGVSI